MGDTVLQVSITARQRLALGVGSEVSYFTDTHMFLPGSVLRGALAAAWIAEYGLPVSGNSTRFRELFDGRIRYGSLHITGSSLIPVSARLCKYPSDAACARQAVDAAFENDAVCPSCGGPLERGKGQVLPPEGLALDRITRTSIDPATAKAKEGELYAHAALPVGTTLSGIIHGRDPWLEQARPLRFGGRRTVGGAADYHATPTEPRPLAEPLTADGQLVIRLAGPGIFVDVAGRPRLDPDPELDLDGATVAKAWTRPMTWSGWHAASRLPKPEELCAAPGSTYRLTGAPYLLNQLAKRLPRAGAGLRRTEGFGDIQIVTSPWRTPIPAIAGQPQTSMDANLRDWHQQIAAFSLRPDQLRWVIAALRTLGIERERQPTDRTAIESLAEELLARPAADEFSGRQRDTLRELFTHVDAHLLRDLTILLLADMPVTVSAGK